MRAIWKGVIRFADIEVPVSLHAALQDRKVHFRLLHAKDHMPVRQQMVDAEDEEVVEAPQIRRAYEMDDGSLVILQPEELEAIKPPPSRDIEILQFVDPTAVGEQWYERPYHLAPDGDESGYAALVAALARTQRLGIARWVMRKKHYVGILCARDDRLALVTMRFADEVIAASDLPRPAGRDPTKKELALAEQLVATLEEPLDMSRFRDEHREQVRELVATKAEGGELAVPAIRGAPRTTGGSLEDALRASLKSGKKPPTTPPKRAAKRATKGARARASSRGKSKAAGSKKGARVG
jgi:DNA end-binding protein Ku